MSSTDPSPLPAEPTESAGAPRTARVTVEAALVVLITVEVPASTEEEARSRALESHAVREYDEVAIAAARSIRDAVDGQVEALRICSVIGHDVQRLIEIGGDRG